MIYRSPKRIKTKKDPKEAYLKRKYGISLEEYEVMRQSQNNRCAICLKEKKLVVDHCHYSNIVRSLLCSACNVAIGHFKEDPEIFHRAAEYINKYREIYKEKVLRQDAALEELFL
jgi:hypothetical protein